MPSVQSIVPSNNQATVTLKCWGAFTVGAVVDGGLVQLELDLAEDVSFPNVFTSR